MSSTPRAPAIAWRGREIARAQLEEEVLAVARRLLALGVRPGDRVGMLAPGSIDWALLAHAIPRIGAVLVPLHARLAQEEVSRQIGEANLSLLLHGGEADLDDATLLSINVEDFRAIAPSAAIPPQDLDPERVSTILFTSGSSGRPRGVMLTRRNHLVSAAASSRVLGLGPEDRWLCCLPLYHVGGLNILYRCLQAGASVLLHDSFDPAQANRAIDREGVTLVSLVSVMLRRMLEERRGRPFPPALRAILVGGGPVEDGLIDACPQALATYGLTETCSHVTLVRPGSGTAERHSAGPPLPGIDVRIVDDGGAALPAGSPGAIEVRGPIVMQGYLNESTPSVVDGWLRTGDLGFLDAAGCLRVAGRSTDLIISGGENIHPAEIEAALLGIPGVEEAAVIGIPDDAWGEVPLAVVARRRSEAVSEESMREAIARHLAERLARFKIPLIVFVSEIPRLPNGKPDRAEIRRRYAG
ncbi:MAG: o-succinylbenzoate--CoA ligase [Candidatus Eisenbacteria bacterium]|nr:o-succinylbenzoate--CoA ligase [Candidatus Eisenbacteria bacterium]